MAAGVPAGPGIRKVLEALLDGVIREEYPNERQAQMCIRDRFQLQLFRRDRLLLCNGKRQIAGVPHHAAGCAFAHRDGTGGLFAALIAGREDVYKRQ